MKEITFRQALGVLAKSSAFSVKTVTQRSNDVFDDIKSYLYIEQDIEKDFRHLLTSVRSGEVIFLCGSSGDGKSEILTRSYQEFHSRFHFHLDATHSFAPNQSAIDALNELFDLRTDNSKPLVLGINIGMLANFAKEGADRHQDIRTTIDQFLEKGIRSENGCHFLDFEQYPKFSFDDHSQTYSSFVSALFERVTKQDTENLLYAIAEKSSTEGRDLRLIANFRFLAKKSVQKIIIQELFKTRLFKDQFITTRALLDFIHQLLVGDGYLFDNMYGSSDNDLILKLKEFDPALKHTQALDQFILRYELGLPDEELASFLQSLAQIGFVFDLSEGNATSLIRAFYLLQDELIGNNYHQKFKEEFNESLLHDFFHVWRLHNQFDGSNELKIALRNFYKTDFIPAIYRYANKNASELDKGEWFLGKFGTVKLAAPVMINPDFVTIQSQHTENRAFFTVFLKVEDISMKGIDINLNLFELIQRLNQGYRPNKYDKGAIVLLDDVVEKIGEIAKKSANLKFYEGSKAYKVSLDDDMIAVSGDF